MIKEERVGWNRRVEDKTRLGCGREVCNLGGSRCCQI